MVNIHRFLDADERRMIVQWFREQAEILENAGDVSGVFIEIDVTDQGVELFNEGWADELEMQVRPVEKQVNVQYTYREGVTEK